MSSYANHHSLPLSGCFLVERGGFSVEGLLDLEEKDAVETEDAPPAAAAAEEAETEKKSQVTYELPLPPPPPEMVDLPAHDVEEELPQQQKKKNKKAEHGENDGGMPKKRGRKPKRKRHLTGAAAASVAASQQASAAQGERRCSHCGVQDTPQWRAGPKGAKTLCNACGVRYKSGRLLPEYRPACSPTFVSSIHSNSHRKVLEMRRNKEAEAEPPVASS